MKLNNSADVRYENIKLKNSAGFGLMASMIWLIYLSIDQWYIQLKLYM